MCRFPASGSSWESLAQGSVSMDDPGGRQRVARQEGGEPAPMEPVAVTPPRQPFLPYPRDLTGVPAQASSVTRYAIVGIVAPHHRDQVGVLVRNRLMSVGPTPSRHRRQRASVTVLGRYLSHHSLDHVVVFGERHLRHLLNSYQKYYNEARTHLSLHKDAPIPRTIQTVGRTLAMPVLGGLHHQYFRA